MRISRQESLTKSFVLDAKDLTVLCESLRSWFTDLKFEITSKDSLKREFDDLEDLLRFENTPATDIRILRIRGYAATNSMWIRFDRDLDQNIFVNLEGDEPFAYQISQLIDDRLSAMRPWYGLISEWKFTGSIPFNWVFLYLVFALIRKVSAKVHPDFATSQTAYVTISLAVGVVGTAIYFLLIRAFFPMGVFALGQGAKRHRHKEILRTIVIAGFVVGVAASLIAALMIGS